MIPDVFWPVTGKWQIRGATIQQLLLYPQLTYLDLHKVYVDDMSYNYGHGHAYRALGVDLEEGAVIIVRPDQCKLQHKCFRNLVVFFCSFILKYSR